MQAPAAPSRSSLVLVYREGAGTKVTLSVEKRELTGFSFCLLQSAQSDQVSYRTCCNAKSRDKHHPVSRRSDEQCRTSLRPVSPQLGECVCVQRTCLGNAAGDEAPPL